MSANVSAGLSSSTGKEAGRAALETSRGGIPQAPFIEDVAAHLGGTDEDAEPHLRKLQETMSKYKMMEVDRRQRQRALDDKIPDIQKTLAMAEHLREKWEAKEVLETHFELNDTLYARARIDPLDSVNLWLGVRAS